MKYMLLMTREPWEDQATEEEKTRVFAAIKPWFGELFAKGKLIEGHQLESPRAAITVEVTEGKAETIRGPYTDRSHPIGGYGILDVGTLDEAIAIAKSFPAPTATLEIRPLLERIGD